MLVKKSIVVLITASARGVFPSSGHAQGIAARCPEAAARAVAPPSREEFHSAVAFLGSRCPAIGPAAIAGAWNAADLDSVAAGILGRESGPVQDERVFRALTRVLDDDSRPRSVRRAAAGALVTQASVCRSIGRVSTGPDGRVSISLVYTAHEEAMVGDSTRAGNVLERTLAVFDEYVRSASDSELRRFLEGTASSLRRMKRYGNTAC